MTPRDSLRALVEADRDATPGPWADPYEQTGEDAGWWVHNGRVETEEYAVAVTLPYNPHAAEDAALIAASRNLAPALAEVVLSLSPEDEGMVERLAQAIAGAPEDAKYFRDEARAVLTALRAHADEKIGEAL